MCTRYSLFSLQFEYILVYTLLKIHHGELHHGEMTVLSQQSPAIRRLRMHHVTMTTQIHHARIRMQIIGRVAGGHLLFIRLQKALLFVEQARVILGYSGQLRVIRLIHRHGPILDGTLSGGRQKRRGHVMMRHVVSFLIFDLIVFLRR